jgi:hypothetical protein
MNIDAVHKIYRSNKEYLWEYYLVYQVERRIKIKSKNWSQKLMLKFFYPEVNIEMYFLLNKLVPKTCD